MVACLTAASQSPGATVLMPPGYCQLKSLTAPLNVAAGVSLRGSGAGITVLNATNLGSYTGGSIITVVGAGSYLADFSVSYDSSGNTHKPDGILVNDAYPFTSWYPYLGGTFATLERIIILNVSGNAFTVNGIEVRLINCYAYAKALSSGTGGHGFNILQTDNFLIGCTADHCGTDGFHIQGANTKLTACKAFGCKGNGFFVGGSGRHMLTTCEAQDNLGHGFAGVNSAGLNAYAGCVADTNCQGTSTGFGFQVFGASSLTGCSAFNRYGTPPPQQYSYSGNPITGQAHPTIVASSFDPGAADVAPGSVGYLNINGTITQS